MRETPGVEFRAKSDAPTKVGHYYARYKRQGKMRPVEVIETSDGFAANSMSRTFYAEPLGMFDWFGEVREVREASQP